MEWVLPIVALALLAVASVSRRISGTPITPAMLFVGIGLLVGPQVLDGVDLPSTGSTVRTLAEATLALVLFSDASRIDLSRLRRDANVPVRLLGIGLPLTIALGTLAALVTFDQLSFEEALIIGVVLAPTDAALGQAVVSNARIPARIRQGLNVESGLNDGICVPLLFIAIAAADVTSDVTGGRTAWTLVLEEIGFGIVGGVAAGILAAVIVRVATRRNLISGAWLQVVPAASAALGYGIAVGLHGSGFIAAFVAGGVFGGLLGRDPGEVNRLTDEVGGVLNGVTFLVFGAVLLGPALGDLSWSFLLYAVLSLTAVRMIPVAVAMATARARPPTLAFMGWFGPRGLASIVFAVILVEESRVPNEPTLLLAIYTTVALSVFAHGISAAPLAARYGRWYAAHPRQDMPPMESVPAEVTRPRHAPDEGR